MSIVKLRLNFILICLISMGLLVFHSVEISAQGFSELENEIAKTEVSKSEVSKSEFSEKNFTHQVGLSVRQGLPSSLTFAVDKEFKVEKLRGLISLDNLFVTLPFNRGPIENSFRLLFPTPKESLSYRLQVVLENGETFLSKEYFTQPGCSKEVFDREVGNIRASSSRYAHLYRLFDLEQREELIGDLIRELDLLGSGTGGSDD